MGRFKIWKFSCFLKISPSSSMVLYFFVFCSIIMNLASLWTIWFGLWKCVAAKIASFFLLSFQLLFNFRLKAVSLLPKYCIKQILHWSKLCLGFYMLTGEMLCMFFLFYIFWRCLFFLLVDKKDNLVLCNVGFRKDFSFVFFFVFVIKNFIACYYFFDFFEIYAIIGLSWNTFFSLGLIWNKYQYLSVFFNVW